MQAPVCCKLHTEDRGSWPCRGPCLAGSRGRGIFGSPLRGRREELGSEDHHIQQRLGCRVSGFEEPNATRNNSLEDALLIESQSRQARVDLQQTVILQGRQFVIQSPGKGSNKYNQSHGRLVIVESGVAKLVTDRQGMAEFFKFNEHLYVEFPAI